jgi:hypothetical protein
MEGAYFATKQSAHPSVVIARSASAFFAGNEAICSTIRCHCEEHISVFCWRRSNLLIHPLSLRGAHQRFFAGDEAICSSIRCHCEERISVLCWRRSNQLIHPLSLRGAHQRSLLATKQSALRINIAKGTNHRNENHF